jgi:hypothetical protein
MRTLFLFAKSIKRIAIALENIEKLYRLDCEARGIIVTNPSIRDQTEISYKSLPEDEYERMG